LDRNSKPCPGKLFTDEEAYLDVTENKTGHSHSHKGCQQHPAANPRRAEPDRFGLRRPQQVPGEDASDWRNPNGLFVIQPAFPLLS
jgi:hypothetical protein